MLRQILKKYIQLKTRVNPLFFKKTKFIKKLKKERYLKHLQYVYFHQLQKMLALLLP